MPAFDPLTYRYASRRNVVYAQNAVACTSVPLGAQIGLDVMKSGGSAVDAAVAMAAAMPLLEPTGNGLGSNCFALVWIERDKRLYGLNASGVAPMALSAEKVRAMGYLKVFWGRFRGGPYVFTARPCLAPMLSTFLRPTLGHFVPK